MQKQVTKTADDHRYRESGLENVVLKGIDIFHHIPMGA
jgi:hypothetical protein